MAKVPIYRQSTIRENLYAVISFISLKLHDLIAVIICLVLMFILNIDNALSRFANERAIDVIAEVYQIINLPFEAVNILTNSIEKHMRIIDENKKLREENSHLQYKLKQMETEISYNASLRKLLNVVESANTKFITSKIISKNFDNFHMNLLINAGSDDGVSENDIVIYNHDLIGRVIEVSKNASRIITIADPQSRLPIIFQDSGEQAIAVGNPKNKDTLYVKYLNNPNVIQDAEQVITSGIGGVFPFGMVIGKAKRDENEVYISTSIEWNKLDYVIVNLQN